MTERNILVYKKRRKFQPEIPILFLFNLSEIVFCKVCTNHQFTVSATSLYSSLSEQYFQLFLTCSRKIVRSFVFPEITINDDHQIAITGIPPQMRTNPFYLFQIIPSSFFPTNLELTTGEISFLVLIFQRRKTTLINTFQR